MATDVFTALADPTRRQIVKALGVRPRSVGELVEELDSYQPGISRNLRILHEAGFVTSEPQGARRIYSLRTEPFQELDTWLGDYRALWEGRMDRLASVVERSASDRRRTRRQ